MSTNKYGLARAIPSNIKQTVRQRCGFACVVCGNPFVQYEHFNPEFSEANEHLTEGITLLCGTCHDKKTKGILPSIEVVRCNSSPYAIAKGLRFGCFYLGGNHPQLKIGAELFINCTNIISINGTNIIKIEPPIITGGMFLLSMHLKNRHGKDSLIIKQNEIVYSKNWDVNWVGTKLTMRAGNRAIDLEMELKPLDLIIIKRMFLKHESYKIIVDSSSIVIKEMGKITSASKLRNNKYTNTLTAISINNGRVALGA